MQSKETEAIKNQTFWLKMANILPPCILGKVRLQKDFSKQTLELWIDGVPTSVHYAYSHDGSDVYFSFVCQSPYLTQKYQKELQSVALSFDSPPTMDNGIFFVSRKLDREKILSGVEAFVSTTIDIVSSFTDDRQALIPTNGKKSQCNLVFETIYSEERWFKGTSGQGSNPTILMGYIIFLNKFIQDNNIRSICDIGCGDWQYMKHVLLDGISYKGYDVSASIVESNSKKYVQENISFEYYNGDFSQITGADLAICKDVLQHLPNQNIFDFLAIAQKFKYVLVANDHWPGMRENKDIIMGQCRPIDLRCPPFCVDALPVFTIDRQAQRRLPIEVFLLQSNQTRLKG